MPFIPHHGLMRASSVNARHTRSRGASKTRLMTSTRSAGSAAMLFFAAIFLFLRVRFALLQLAQIVLEAIERLLPETAIVFEPVRRVLERSGGEPAWTPLRLAAALDKASALQHFEVLGNGGHAHLEGLGQLGHGGLARSEAGEDRAASRIGQRRESRVELLGRCVLLNHSVK